MLAFGPVPSRRLGYSLGINHIPPKHCPYACVYCQVGRTNALSITQQSFYPLDQILGDVKEKVLAAQASARTIDYLTLVPDGEPALDANLGNLILALKQFNIPIAVISNAALMHLPDVQQSLLSADWVSLKVDAVLENEWRLINRPHRRLSLPKILDNILSFRNSFRGEFVTETMLVGGVNDNDAALSKLFYFLQKLNPHVSYLSIPTRPPAEAWVKPPDAANLQRSLDLLSGKLPFLELMFTAEPADFVATGNIVEDILATTAVHPIREKALQLMLGQAGEEWSLIENLLLNKKIVRINYRNENFYLGKSS